MTRRIGLTGGIASGKSTVSARLAELGAVVIDSDLLAREAVEAGSAGLEQVVRLFGPGVLATDGTLDRAALGRVVFADPDARARLEAIVHPIVRRRSSELATAAEREGAALVVFDIPLLVETDQQHDFDAVLVVDADERDQVRRIMARNGLSQAEARARVDAQATRAERRAAATHVLLNDAGVEDLLRHVDALWPQLVRPAGV